MAESTYLGLNPPCRDFTTLVGYHDYHVSFLQLFCRYWCANITAFLGKVSSLNMGDHEFMTVHSLVYPKLYHCYLKASRLCVYRLSPFDSTFEFHYGVPGTIWFREHWDL